MMRVYGVVINLCCLYSQPWGSESLSVTLISMQMEEQINLAALRPSFLVKIFKIMGMKPWKCIHFLRKPLNAKIFHNKFAPFP